MVKTLATAAAMMLLVSSFALAGQSSPRPVAPRAPRAHQRVSTQSELGRTSTQRQPRKRHHKKHHSSATSSKRSHGHSRRER